jgi:hypothetical protein
MGIVAIVCGWLLMSGRADRMKMDPNVLKGSPFRTFTIPGLILTIAVGGTNVIGAAGLILRKSWGMTAAFIAGCALMGWMIGQVILLGIQGPKWQQPLYFGYGLLSALVAWRLNRTFPIPMRRCLDRLV